MKIFKPNKEILILSIKYLRFNYGKQINDIKEIPTTFYLALRLSLIYFISHAVIISFKK